MNSKLLVCTTDKNLGDNESTRCANLTALAIGKWSSDIFLYSSVEEKRHWALGTGH
jgi:hypothetical protein